jgi:hypothetical protein
MRYSPLRQPGRPECQDPWFCVTRLLWLCPFGDLSLITAAKPDAGSSASPVVLNRKSAQSSAEDERSWNTSLLPGPKMRYSPLRQPGRPECQDPWFCVTRLLWLCPFGDFHTTKNLNELHYLHGLKCHVKSSA